MKSRPKYQVFISSTYIDLHTEREAVTWAVLMARQIPVGMENFPASDDRGWKTITGIIDRTDYYVLLIGGMYGSMAADGMSWTEKEYDYARSRGIPVLAFTRAESAITATVMDKGDETRAKLESFKSKVRGSHHCREWSVKEELPGLVSFALNQQIIDDAEDGRSRPGWYRGDEMPLEGTVNEFARLSAENATLKARVDELEQANANSNKVTIGEVEGQFLLDISSAPQAAVYRSDTNSGTRFFAGGKRLNNIEDIRDTLRVEGLVERLFGCGLLKHFGEKSYQLTHLGMQIADQFRATLETGEPGKVEQKTDTD